MSCDLTRAPQLRARSEKKQVRGAGLQAFANLNVCAPPHMYALHVQRAVQEFRRPKRPCKLEVAGRHTRCAPVRLLALAHVARTDSHLKPRSIC